MKNTLYGVLLSSLLILTGSYRMSSYTVDSNYSIQFETGKAEGSFQGLEGKVEFNPDNLSSSIIDVSVAVNTIQTGNTRKDDHAKGKKWFDAEQFPRMTFASSTISKMGTGYIAIGDLTVKDVTKEVEISFSSDYEENGNYLNGVFSINRKDYNINGNIFGFAVGKDVLVRLKVPVEYRK